ncbi:unnamed protein product [Brassicogethes aeneus]|uniref:Protein hunchback n=1 Tax=Brassicogethes aeneus TaxID=1431903 RepID=A0A9P0AZL0_BRAAE|nr:unnamed protein product [Brassicogethes aeneus]
MSSSFEQNNPVNININDLVGCSEISNGYGYSESQPSTSNSMVKMERDSDSENDSCDTMDFDGMKDEPPEGFDMIEAKVEMEEGAALDTRNTTLKQHKCFDIYCNFTTTNIIRLNYHMEEHGTQYQCPKCTFSSRNKYRFQYHLNKHEGEQKYYKCQFCMYTSFDKYLLVSHEATQHSECETVRNVSDTVCLKIDGTEKKDSVQEDVSTFGECFNKVEKFCKYMVATETKDLEIYKCTIFSCRFKTKDKYRYKTHLEEHNSLYKCPKCNFQSKNKYRYTYHVQKHSSKICYYKCLKCPFKTTDKYRFKYHKNGHNTEHVCPECGFKTTNKYSLKTHIMRHQNLKNKCNNLSAFRRHTKHFKKDNKIEKIKCVKNETNEDEPDDIFEEFVDQDL